MNDIRRTILWVIFGFSMVLLWDQWQVHNGNKATFFPQAPVAGSATAKGPAGPSSVPTSSVPAAATSATPGAVPGTSAGALPVTPSAAPAAPREKITVT